jgi:ribosome-binding factor A
VSNRIVRINELVQREISDILRQRFTAESAAITVSEVRIAPDLRDGRVFVAILGAEDEVAGRFRWLQKRSAEIRGELARRIVLKFIPHLTYVLDKSSDRAARVLHALDQIEPAAEEPTDTSHGDLLP